MVKSGSPEAGREPTCPADAGDSQEISKQEALRVTGISYGQFYRWKRMGLIPESWFRRRATFTGQETFLPRAKLLARIRRIQELKDRYPLEEIARMLSPDATRASFSRDEVEAAELLPPRAHAVIPLVARKETFDFADLLVLALVGRLASNDGLSEEHLRLAAETLQAHFDALSGQDGERRLAILHTQGVHLAMMHTGELLCDRATETVVSVSLNELAEEVKVRLRSIRE